MTPFDQAYQTFHAEPTELDWHEVIQRHLEQEYCYQLATEYVFACARLVHSSMGKREILDTRRTWAGGDELHVTIAAGDLRLMVDHIPGSVETLSFQRRGYRLHRIRLDRFKALVL